MATSSSLGSSQSQSTTGNPQAGVQSLNTGTPSGAVQPAPTAGSPQSNSQAAALQGTSSPHLTLVAPAASAQTRTATVASPPAGPKKHHTNPVLFGAAVVLLLAAIVLFWLTNRSVKSTT
jgi:hypothetical protein